MDVSAIAVILRQIPRGWDSWDAESFTTHGSEMLNRQEANRIASTLTMLEDCPSPGRILEIGTGYLSMAVVLRRRFPAAQLTGVEHPGRPYVWKPAYREVHKAERICLAAADLVGSGLPFRTATFDVAVLAEVLEHLPPNAVPAVLTEIARILVPGGTLVLTTPNLAAWTNRELLLRGHSPQQSPARCIDGTYPHLRLYTRAELEDLLVGTGFRVERGSFIDQKAVGISFPRRVLRTALAPARTVWPALRDTILLLARRSEDT
jgi:SAM-dependent methyltransferase